MVSICVIHYYGFQLRVCHIMPSGVQHTYFDKICGWTLTALAASSGMSIVKPIFQLLLAVVRDIGCLITFRQSLSSRICNASCRYLVRRPQLSTLISISFPDQENVEISKSLKKSQYTNLASKFRRETSSAMGFSLEMYI